MAKNDRSNLERLLRSAWERQTALRLHQSQPSAHSTSVHSKSIVRVFLELVFGLGLSVVGVMDLFPLWVSILLCVGAMFFIIVGLQEVIRPVGQFKGLALSITVLAVYLWIIHFPLVSRYNKEINLTLELKEPSHISWFRQQLMRYDIAKARDFLSDLHIDVPAELPPIIISSELKGSTSLTPPNLPSYRYELSIGSSAVFNRHEVTQMYVDYVLDHMRRKNSGQLNDFLIIGSSIDGFSTYFNASFWNENLNFRPVIPPASQLWRIRQQIGSSLTDRIATAALKTMADTPDAVRGKDWNTYLFRSLMIGDSIVEGRCSNWEKIAKVFEDEGTSKGDLNSQVFAPDLYVPRACANAFTRY